MLRAAATAALACGVGTSTRAQSPVLFDFDTGPVHVSLPLDYTVGGITAHLSATGQGYSIQPANTMGFTPAGFSGNCIYPNSVFSADLLVSFSSSLTAFSIMFAPQELGCDDTATMRVTAYLNGVLLGTNTAMAPQPGTWPTGTLSFTSAQPFNSVVVHYDHRPPTCQDWGPIFLADNMIVTPGGGPPACYANCDGSTVTPVLNVNDFVCFQNKFAAGDPYANCDHSTATPVLNVNDFVCFQAKFAAGCP
jgi:hypothetical protein